MLMYEVIDNIDSVTLVIVGALIIVLAAVVHEGAGK